MLVNELLKQLESEKDYVPNSLILTSADDSGCIYKWLSYNEDGQSAHRREMFVAADGKGGMDERNIIIYVEVIPAS